MTMNINLIILVVAVVVAITAIAISTIYVVNMHRIVKKYSKLIMVFKKYNELLSTNHMRDMHTIEFMYSLLLDVASPMRDESILYKIRNIQVILMTMDIENGARNNAIFRDRYIDMPTAKTFDDMIHQMFVEHNSGGIFEPDTENALKRFTDLMDKMNEYETAEAEEYFRIKNDFMNYKINKNDPILGGTDLPLNKNDDFCMKSDPIAEVTQ